MHTLRDKHHTQNVSLHFCMTIKTVLFVIIILIVLMSFFFNVPQEIMNFSVVMALLVTELAQFLQYRQRIKSTRLIKFKSYNWLGGWVTIVFAVYWFSTDLYEVWNLVAIAGVIIYGVLKSLQNLNLRYELNEEGLRNISTNKLIATVDITAVKFDERRLTIHTTKYQNELILKSEKLLSPSWDKLTNELSSIVQ